MTDKVLNEQAYSTGMSDILVEAEPYISPGRRNFEQLKVRPVSDQSGQHRQACSTDARGGLSVPIVAAKGKPGLRPSLLHPPGVSSVGQSGVQAHEMMTGSVSA